FARAASGIDQIIPASRGYAEMIQVFVSSQFRTETRSDFSRTALQQLRAVSADGRRSRRTLLWRHSLLLFGHRSHGCSCLLDQLGADLCAELLHDGRNAFAHFCKRFRSRIGDVESLGDQVLLEIFCSFAGNLTLECRRFLTGFHYSSLVFIRKALEPLLAGEQNEWRIDMSCLGQMLLHFIEPCGVDKSVWRFLTIDCAVFQCAVKLRPWKRRRIGTQSRPGG